MGWSVQGSVVTAKAKQAVPCFYKTGTTFVGPIVIMPNFPESGECYDQGYENWGSLTMGNVKTTASNSGGDSPGGNADFEYNFTITNDSDWVMLFDLAVGTFGD